MFLLASGVDTPFFARRATDRFGQAATGVPAAAFSNTSSSSVRVDADRVAVREVALEQPQRERVLDEPLDRPLQRPGAVRRIPARLGERFLRRVRQLERDAPLGEPVAQPFELELDDLRDLVARERLELDDLVDAVQELRPEPVAKLRRRCGRSRS